MADVIAKPINAENKGIRYGQNIIATIDPTEKKGHR